MRSHITFEHCLSHTSGASASKSFLQALGYPDGVIDGMDHVEAGWMELGMTLEESAMNVYNASTNIPELPAPYRYHAPKRLTHLKGNFGWNFGGTLGATLGRTLGRTSGSKMGIKNYHNIYLYCVGRV